MKELIENFPDQLRESLEIGRKQTLNISSKTISQVVFCGLGGSGIGAKIVAQWVEQALNIPVTHVQNYAVPNWVDENALVIGSSYSGNTEETLSALEECKKRGAVINGVTSGGKLVAFCEENNYNVILVPGGLPPRAALGYSLVQLLVVLEQYGLISNEVITQLEGSASHIEKLASDIQAEAKKIVSLVDNTTMSLYAEAPYEAIAVRGKQQFNENSKFLCRYHVLPEMNHNELLGWGCGTNDHSAIFILTSDILPRNKKRFELTQEIIEKKTNRIAQLVAKGSNRIEESMYLIHVLDWASYYLGTQRGEDVVEIRMIDYLKSELAK